MTTKILSIDKTKEAIESEFCTLTFSTQEEFDAHTCIGDATNDDDSDGDELPQLAEAPAKTLTQSKTLTPKATVKELAAQLKLDAKVVRAHLRKLGIAKSAETSRYEWKPGRELETIGKRVQKAIDADRAEKDAAQKSK